MKCVISVRGNILEIGICCVIGSKKVNIKPAQEKYGCIILLMLFSRQETW